MSTTVTPDPFIAIVQRAADELLPNAERKAGIRRKRQWIINSYKGPGACALKARENEAALNAIVEAWKKCDSV